MREKQYASIFLLPSLIILVGISIFPLIYSAVLSFFNWDMASKSGMSFIGLNNYWLLIQDPEFLSSIAFTVLLVVAGTIIEASFGMFIANWFDKSIRKGELLKIIIICPALLSPIVAATVWKMFYHPMFGLINYIISFFGVKPVEWLSDPALAKVAILITDIWQWTPFMFLFFLSGLQALPKSPIEAANVDGASKWKILFHVTLPMLKPVIMVAILFRVVDLFKIFDLVYMLTRGGPAIATQTTSMFVYFRAFRYFRIGNASAASFILLFVILIPISLAMKYFLRKNEDAR